MKKLIKSLLLWVAKLFKIELDSPLPIMPMDFVIEDPTGDWSLDIKKGALTRLRVTHNNTNIPYESFQDKVIDAFIDELGNKGSNFNRTIVPLSSDMSRAIDDIMPKDTSLSTIIASSLAFGFFLSEYLIDEDQKVSLEEKHIGPNELEKIKESFISSKDSIIHFTQESYNKVVQALNDLKDKPHGHID